MINYKLINKVAQEAETKIKVCVMAVSNNLTIRYMWEEERERGKSKEKNNKIERERHRKIQIANRGNRERIKMVNNTRKIIKYTAMGQNKRKLTERKGKMVMMNAEKPIENKREL